MEGGKKAYSLLSTPSMKHKIIFSFILLIDSAVGLRYGWGIISQLSFLHLDLIWMGQCAEFIFSGFALINFSLSLLTGWKKSIALILSPLAIIALLGLCIELLLLGRGQSALIAINLANHGITGLVWAATYLSIAAGLTLTYRVQGYGNFAQSEFLVFGAYIALSLMLSERFLPGVDAPKDGILAWELLIWACIGAFILTGIVGVIVDFLVMKKFRNKGASYQVMMIASLGVAMVIRAMLYLRYGSQTQLFVPDRDWRLSTSKFEIDSIVNRFTLGVRDNIPFRETVDNIYGLAYTKVALIVGVFGSVLLLLLLLNGTRLGRKMRAVADNPDLAAASGINIEGVHRTSAFLSAGLSGFGGALFAMTTRMNPEVGLTILLPSFAVIVLGTIGSIRGAIIGSLIVGIIRSVSQPVLVGIGSPLNRPTISGMDEVMPYLFLIVVLMLMPKGLGDALEKAKIEKLRRRATKEGNLFLSSMQNYWTQLKQILIRPMRILEDFFDKITTHLQKVNIYFQILLKPFILKVQALWLHITTTLTVWKNNGIDFFNQQINSLSKEESSKDSPISVNPAPPGTIFLCLICLPFINAILGLWMVTLIIGIPLIYVLILKPNSIWRTKVPFGREQALGSWIILIMACGIMLGLAWSIPSVSAHTKWMGMARMAALLGIFGILSFSLNLHTGYSGMSNFGVIFFASIGAIIVGLMSAGYGWYWWQGILLAIPIAALIGWLLAYPTANLRMDYFAIVTVSLGEIVRIALASEPLLRAGTSTSAIGISKYEIPFEPWWDSTGAEWFGEFLNLGKDAPYQILIGIVALACLVGVWIILETSLKAPWGRILRAIREDQEVTQHHGHDVFKQKAGSLALGAAIAALGGALWAWLNAGIFPDFMNPANTTFLIWAAFIVGGRASNRGMFAGAFLIVLLNLLFTAFSTAQNDTEHSLYFVVEWINSALDTIIRDIIPDMFASQAAIDEVFPKGEIIATLTYVKLFLIGMIIIVTLHLAPKGILPEIPFRPKFPEAIKGGEQE
ncbi:MAG TPA: hypothetical protein EYQ53_04480 [Candidatus Poseidoniales archaeon]|jgi:ABC-type branched-subunit amino acid transport system permease subunit|nr:MAG: hypothetical protein CXT68_04570 [Euryarchaeota archaeon]HIG03620.1 hypothetical protein [Candidatus Poseidoniales archaeon]HIK78252.1 hypothetical protein [Candidatus Poseidoniales archaeon]